MKTIGDRMVRVPDPPPVRVDFLAGDVVGIHGVDSHRIEILECFNPIRLDILGQPRADDVPSDGVGNRRRHQRDLVVRSGIEGVDHVLKQLPPFRSRRLVEGITDALMIENIN
ncbi:MAG: hypothetical protein V5A46_11635 [Haloferacaceae archaeon]